MRYLSCHAGGTAIRGRPADGPLPHVTRFRVKQSRTLAVKVLTPEAAVKPEMRLRFEREARAMAGRDNQWT